MERCENCGCSEFLEYVYTENGHRLFIRECKDCAELIEEPI